MTLDNYIKKLGDMPLYQDSVKQIKERFDTTVRVDTTTSKLKLCTHEINYFVNHLDWEFEGTLRVSLFTYESGIPVYADPPTYRIGIANPVGFGYIPDMDWEDWLKENNINPDIIKEIKNVLKSKPPVNY